MKAALCYGPHDVRVEDVPEPRPGIGEIVVRIVYCGICGSDLSVYKGTFALLDSPWWPQPPFPMGHEASGIVAALGPGLLSDYNVGQRVAMNFRTACGACGDCRPGREHLCEHVIPHEAAMAEYCLYREAAVYLLPDDVSLQHGALLEPVTIALHAVDQGCVFPGATVAIFGAGTIGLLIEQLAKRAGAARVLVIDPIREKHELAALFGADMVIDPLKQEPIAAGMALTQGRGFDTVFEASGTTAAAERAMALAGGRGTVVWAGIFPRQSKITVDPYAMFANEVTLRASQLAPYVYPRALRLLSKLDLDPMITEIVSLADIAHVLETRTVGTSIKTLVKCDG